MWGLNIRAIWGFGKNTGNWGVYFGYANASSDLMFLYIGSIPTQMTAGQSSVTCTLEFPILQLPISSLPPIPHLVMTSCRNSLKICTHTWHYFSNWPHLGRLPHGISQIKAKYCFFPANKMKYLGNKFHNNLSPMEWLAIGANNYVY